MMVPEVACPFTAIRGPPRGRGVEGAPLELELVNGDVARS
jgi:hypothetical protein